MSEITSKERWWAEVGKAWSELENIILQYYPNQSDFPEDGWPLPVGSLQHPQRACNAVIKKLRKERPIWSSKGNFKKFINSLKENKDVELSKILNASWFGLPESAATRSLPGFSTFCDLCSESNVLYEKENEKGFER